MFFKGGSTLAPTIHTPPLHGIGRPAGTARKGVSTPSLGASGRRGLQRDCGAWDCGSGSGISGGGERELRRLSSAEQEREQAGVEKGFHFRGQGCQKVSGVSPP